MKTRTIAIALTTACAATVPLAVQAKGPAAQIVEKDAHGHAQKVRVDGRIYDVCRKGHEDNCINPRAAGLAWGNRPLESWPGAPASEMRR